MAASKIGPTAVSQDANPPASLADAWSRWMFACGRAVGDKGHPPGQPPAAVPISGGSDSRCWLGPKQVFIVECDRDDRAPVSDPRKQLGRDRAIGGKQDRGGDDAAEQKRGARQAATELGQ